MIGLPDSNGAVVVLSGGMDSTIALKLAINKYGKDNVQALSFFYWQKQSVELYKARRTCENLGVKQQVVTLDFMHDFCKGVSANIDEDMPMPSIQDVIGDPSPPTYVPNRNMMMIAIAASLAEAKKYSTIIVGLQEHDMYNYHDTTERFLVKINDLLAENRKHKIKVVAPFINMTKTDELKLLLDMDGNVDILKYTLTCYAPDDRDRSCGKCPSCAERLKAFKNVGIEDPIEYVI